jgi:hypothetical protein
MIFSTEDLLIYLDKKGHTGLKIRAKEIIKEMEEKGAYCGKSFVITADCADRAMKILHNITWSYGLLKSDYDRKTDEELEKDLAKHMEKADKLQREYELMNNWCLENRLVHYIGVSTFSCQDRFENEIYNRLNGRITREDAHEIVQGLSDEVNRIRGK